MSSIRQRLSWVVLDLLLYTVMLFIIDVITGSRRTLPADWLICLLIWLPFEALIWKLNPNCTRFLDWRLFGRKNGHE